MVPALFTAAIVAFIAVWDWMAVRGRTLSPWPAIIAALALPFVVPASLIFVRTGFTILGTVLALKTWELAQGRVSDPSMLRTPWLAMFWLLIPPDSRFPTSPAAARNTRLEGLRRSRRGLAKVPLALTLAGLEMYWPGVHSNPWLEALWALWLVWAAMTAVADIWGGLAMLTGLHVSEPFNTPMLARSPRDFWGERWNLFVQRWMRRNIFGPVGGRRHPLRGVVIVFVFSGLLHEYVIIAALGHVPDRVGWMTAFFALHGLAVVAEVGLRHKRRRAAARRRGPGLPRAVAVAVHLVWLTATAPLFFGPLGEIFATL